MNTGSINKILQKIRDTSSKKESVLTCVFCAICGEYSAAIVLLSRATQQPVK